jgi:uncharacterized membrane protein (UPF0127 family)
MRVRSVVVVVVVLSGVGACSRMPPEPAPTVQADTSPRAATVAAEPAAATAASPTTAQGRSVVDLPSTAPAPPAAADASRCPRDPDPGPALPLAELSFPEAPGAPRIEVELAKTPHDIEKGLMYRREMPENHGMLFRLDGRRDQTFWMHNTCIPLDMLFIDDDGLVVGIVEAAAPLTDTPRSVGRPSVFVLEMNAGWARGHGVKPGQKIPIPFAAR